MPGAAGAGAAAHDGAEAAGAEAEAAPPPRRESRYDDASCVRVGAAAPLVVDRDGTNASTDDEATRHTSAVRWIILRSCFLALYLQPRRVRHYCRQGKEEEAKAQAQTVLVVVPAKFKSARSMQAALTFFHILRRGSARIVHVRWSEPASSICDS